MSTLTAAELAGMRTTVTGTELGMTAKVERPTAGAADAWGHPALTWGTLHAAVACFWYEHLEREVLGPNVNALVSRQYLVVPFGTDVRAEDRVATVRGFGGELLASNVRITEVRVRTNDIVCALEQVGGAL